MPRIASLPLFLECGGGTLQQQIYRGIRRCIDDGLVDANYRLPSTRALAADLGVSRTTALLALEQLSAEGFVVARRGSGVFIAPRQPARRARADQQLESQRLVPRVSRPPFSRRGAMLAATGAPDRRKPSTNARAFRLGTPALDLFPHRTWSRLTRDALRGHAGARLDYAPLAGLPELRAAIAELVQSRGTRCDAEQVQIVAGAQRGLDLLAHMLLDPGDDAWIEDPGYPGARAALVAAGARIVPMPVDEDGMCVEGGAIAARLAYVTPSCQFPLGVAMSLARRRQLLQWARRSRAWIVEDDYDCDIRYEARSLPCLHSLDPDGRVIYLGTFSKSLFPALRLGFLIVPRELAAGFVTARLATDLHPPVLEQRVLAAFIAQGHFERHIRRMQSAYAERLDTLRRAIQTSGLPLTLRAVHAGMHAVLDVEGADAERLHAEAAALGVESMPLSSYYWRGGRRPNALLLGFGAVPPIAIRQGVVKLGHAMEAARVNPTATTR
ncbi:MAG: PLP-dependent aminotransferase family protein [Steroidobacteraceae bacterium]|nr:PLP-dependent aminotransferase family protein [Steroidobacteraceae bacterium]